MTLQAGTHLGPYEILGPLGAGGMGEVYEALDTRLERKVAVKVLPERVAGDPVAMARFEREAKAVAALSHPNILAIFDFGRAGDAAYAVTELLEGETLRARLEAGPIPPRKAVAMARQVASGIGAAHEKGIVHRDLKPENLFVMTDGAVKILDFGLAVQGPQASGAAGTQTPTREQITTPGSVVGTTSYMSPEQVRGQHVDHRSDIFSLGSVLYEMLTGARAFHAETAAETMTAVLREDPAELPPERAILPALERIVRRCLEKRPEERFHSAHDLAFALGNVWGASSSRAEAVVPAEMPSTKQFPKARRLIAAASMLALGALAGAFLMQRLARPPVTEPVRTQQLTFSGRDDQPDISPDGRLIAFSSSRDGQSRIWVKQHPGGGEAALTEGPDHAPRFSPDQTSLLFVRDQPGGSALFRVPLVGGTPRKLLDDVAEADWSPDGRQIAVLHRPVVTGDGGNIQRIGIVDVDGTGERQIAETANRVLSGIRWSPDGSRIAVTSGTAVNSGQVLILLVDARTGERTTIQPLDLNATGVAWSGRGEAIVYGSSRDLTAGVSSSTARVVRQDLRSGETRTLMWARSLFAGSGYGSSTLDVGAPGTLVYGALALKQNLSIRAIAGADGAASTLLTRGASRDRQPVYTPDGENVIFSSNRSGNLDLWSMSLESGSITRLTEDTADDWDPAVTPDGSLLWSSSRSGNLEIWMANRDGTGARQVSHDGVDAENPTCTPDGRWIVYASGNPDKLGLWKIHPDGSGATLLVPGSQFLPEVSPDGRYALFATTAPSETANVIRVVEIETGKIVPFEILVRRSAPGRVEQPGSGNLGRARWRRDGRALLFLGVDDENRSGVYEQAFVIGTDTAGSRRRVAGFSPEMMTESFAVSPDGSRMVLSEIELAYSLMVAENLPDVEPPSRP